MTPERDKALRETWLVNTTPLLGVIFQELFDEIDSLRTQLAAVWLAASGDGCTVVQAGSKSHSDALKKVNFLREDRDALCGALLSCLDQLESSRSAETTIAHARKVLKGPRIHVTKPVASPVERESSFEVDKP
jgi:hypothetical protein